MTATNSAVHLVLVLTDVSKQEANQLVGPSEMRASWLENHCKHIDGDLSQIVTDLFESMPDGPVLCTFVQYSVRFSPCHIRQSCKDVGLDLNVEFWGSSSNHSWVIKLSHFVSNKRRRSTELAAIRKNANMKFHFFIRSIRMNSLTWRNDA